MIRNKAIAMLAALALTASAGSGTGALAEAESDAPQYVLVVLAHPDDELTMAPALASLARQGAQVTVLYATTGDQGPGVSGLAKGAKLGKLREDEAECAITALGLTAQLNFNRGDGALGMDAHHPKSVAKGFAEDITNHLPGYSLVLTWGPDGGYGHADHRMVSALATQAVQAMRAEVRPRLLYVGIPAGSLPPVPEMADWAVSDPALLTQSIAYTPADLAAASAAAQCHVTQFDEETRAAMMGLFDATIWRGKVHFRPAF